MKKFLYTFFFGYLSFKYRRLIRTPIILTTIILMGSGIIIGLDKPFPDKELIRKIYNEYPLYVTPGNEYYTIKESERDFPDSLNYYLENGILREFNISYERFYNLLWTDDNLLKTISRNYYKEKGISDNYYYDFRRYTLDLIETSERFEELILLSVFVLGGLSFIFLLSFLLEPFILDKKKKKEEELEEGPQIDSLVFEKEDEIKSILNEKNNVNKETSGLIKYFKFNNEYITGLSYLNRMLVSVFTSIIFGLGLLLMISTIYKRSKSLGFNKTVSIVNCIIIPLSFILNLVISETEKRFGESDDILMIIIPVVLTIPHFILLFKNGTRKKMGKFQVRT
jgi:hypothetical protein